MALNFDFAPATHEVRDAARAMLQREAAGSARRAMAEGGSDAALWQRIGALGWVGAAIPEAEGGAGLGSEALCAIAEALGAHLAATPFASTVYLVAEAITLFGEAAQRRHWLPPLAAGTLAGACALGAGGAVPAPRAVAIAAEGDRLTGEAWPVPDAADAGLFLVAARAPQGVGLFLVPRGEGVACETLPGLDPSRGLARLRLDAAPGTPLPGARDWTAIERLLDRAAIYLAFEQLGGAEAALAMACRYATERSAFGRKIGSFQAIKHKLADVYVAIELARSNAYYGAWALAADAPDLPSAAAAARIAATRAFELAAAENIQVHGGMGFTWESDCHLFYRRAKHLALVLGGAPHWKDRLVHALERRNAA